MSAYCYRCSYIMAKYYIPPDMSEKEKIIGGKLNFNQFLWLIAGAGAGGLFLVVSFLITRNMVIGVFLGVIGIIPSIPFAFYKKNGLTLMEYFKRKLIFKKKVKIIPNKRKVI